MEVGQNSLTYSVRNTIKQQRELVQKVETANATGLRSITDLSETDLINAGLIETNIASFQGRSDAITDLITYVESAGTSIKAMSDSIEYLLELANMAIDPSKVGDLPTLNQQCAQMLQQMQDTVDNTHDADGNAILNGSIATYSAAATTNISIIVADNNIMRAANAFAANTNLKAAFAGANLGTETIIKLDNAANIAITTGGGFASTIDYISRAMSIIPAIGVELVELNTPVSEAVRAAKISALLGQAVTDAIAATNVVAGPNVGNLAIAQQNIYPSMIAALTNETIAAGRFVTSALAPTGAAADNAAAIRALLTSSEIAALKNLVATGASLDAQSLAGNAADGGANPAAIFMGDLSRILQNITCLQNVTELCPAASAPLTDLFGDVTAFAPPITGGNVVPGNIFGPTAQSTISTYLTNAALERVVNGKNFSVQVGSVGTDILSLKIDDVSPFALGLSNLRLVSAADAQTTIAILTKASLYIAGASSRINQQVTQLGSRQNIINIQINNAIDNFNNIMKSDPIENSSKLTAATNNVEMATAFLTVNETLSTLMHRAVREILAQAAHAA